MRCDNYCPRCGELEEYVTQAIFECPPALHVWKIIIIKPEQDMDPYPWVIWYIWKARNDKLFRGIDRDPLELVRYAESECQAWFNANEVVQPVVQEIISAEPQVISLGNICLLDGFWTASAPFRKHSIAGDKKFQSTGINFAFGSRSSAVGNGEHASTLNLPELWDRLQ
uniref:Reverse transcriptase zinc-binding domain-containing protein n=1 Tax=Brassica oleracea var. oleracea TaxID=109376 RepID=A0A0D3AMJ2_BRAOL